MQLEDGDIICYQRALTRGEEDVCRYPDVPSFLEYVRNRQVLRTNVNESLERILCPMFYPIDYIYIYIYIIVELNVVCRVGS